MQLYLDVCLASPADRREEGKRRREWGGRNKTRHRREWREKEEEEEEEETQGSEREKDYFGSCARSCRALEICEYRRMLTCEGIKTLGLHRIHLDGTPHTRHPSVSKLALGDLTRQTINSSSSSTSTRLESWLLVFPLSSQRRWDRCIIEECPWGHGGQKQHTGRNFKVYYINLKSVKKSALPRCSHFSLWGTSWTVWPENYDRDIFFFCINLISQP